LETVDDVYVALIARPHVDEDAVGDWLQALGALDWWEAYPEQFVDAELVAELAGRRCYAAFGTELNANITRTRAAGSAEYIENVVAQRHGSVFEHGMFTFAIENVSRVLTHELVRHRVGTAISQESGRYVRLDAVRIEHPDFIRNNDQLLAHAEELVEAFETFARMCATATGIDEPGADFARKKAVTSAIRRYAPEGRATGLVWSANLRTLRLLIELRTAPGAETEIRRLFDRIAQLVREETPAVMADFDRSEDGTWTPTHSRV
jgi:thymidylate synthase (FAD)